MPSADAGTAFSAGSAETDRSAPSTEAPAPAETARPRAEVPSVDKSGLESAYTRLQGLLQQAPDLSDKTADTANNYRQARLEAESLAQQALTALSSQTVRAEEVAQVQTQLVASSKKLEASIAGLQVAVKPGVEPSATVEEKATEPAPAEKLSEEPKESTPGETVTSPRESTAKAEESAPARPETSPATDNAKPEPALTAEAEEVTYTVNYIDQDTREVVLSKTRTAIIKPGDASVAVSENGKEISNEPALHDYWYARGDSLERRAIISRGGTATITYEMSFYRND